MVTAAQGLKKRGHKIILSGKNNSVFMEQAKNAHLRTIPLNIRADYSPLKIWNTKKILEQEKIDVIVLNLNKDIRVAGIAAKLAKVPVIIARNGIQLIADTWKHKQTMNIVDGIITNSKSIENVYNSYSWMQTGKTRVIYNGIKINGEIKPADLRIIWNIPSNHTIFLAAGRLTHQKGFDLLIEAVSRINMNKYPCTILIAGRGKHRRRLEQMVKDRNLEKHIKLIGFQQNLPGIIIAADFIIMSSRQEGMPNIIMESMALGKPVLAADVNGVPELVEHDKTGFIFEPHNIEAITRSMVWVLKNRHSDQIKSWGVKAREAVAHKFTMDIMLDNLEAYFYELYERSNR